MAFKKGDRVVCLNDYGASYDLKAGRMYTVIGMREDAGEDVRLEGLQSSWRADRFALYAPPQGEATDRILAGLVKLGPRARLLLAEVTERLVKGAAEHGDFDPTKRRNWNREAAEERLDALVYETIDALERAGSWK